MSDGPTCVTQKMQFKYDGKGENEQCDFGHVEDGHLRNATGLIDNVAPCVPSVFGDALKPFWIGVFSERS